MIINQQIVTHTYTSKTTQDNKTPYYTYTLCIWSGLMYKY